MTAKVELWRVANGFPVITHGFCGATNGRTGGGSVAKLLITVCYLQYIAVLSLIYSHI
jgi:hypothetical protein